ncbi:OLC1v1027018C1 [Oldenlandia corymbosa var. corymbosa]|uniref:4-hydroxybenzoate polyprenyltransferase, mitochondrial n=1 Tax=Oldenlandia corymbosa var. corymbosa TaxID=529605 RepID=A0AAV1CBQ9_OLDCO|nr:OLC1v1027018C1 [Oldenlandia corymbosa var. corymbosa]
MAKHLGLFPAARLSLNLKPNNDVHKSSILLLKPPIKSNSYYFDPSFCKLANVRRLGGAVVGAYYDAKYSEDTIHRDQAPGGGEAVVVEEQPTALPAAASDNTNWIDVHLPEKARPYAYLVRFNNQIGPWIVGWPYFLSIALTAEPGKLPDMKMLGLFLVIAFMERNIMMTINDIIDQDIDAKVERTKTRPIAAGSISTIQAVCFLGFQMLINYVLYHQVNPLSRKLWLLSVIMTFTYPITKRITYLSQAYLSIYVHWGALMSWAAVKGSLEPFSVLLPLFISGFFWTLLYETIYACQDKEADAKLGLKSTALLFGDSIKVWLAGFGVATISGFALTGFNANIGWPYYTSLVAAAYHLAWQIVTVDLENPADCKLKQKSNKWIGVILFFGIVLGKLVA